MNFFRSALSVLIVSALVILSSCQKELSAPGGGNNNPPVNPTPVQARVQGTVIDENNQPVEGAVVKAGNKTATTDQRGLFQFGNLALDKYASVVTVEKPGYFKGIRTFSTKAGASNFVKIKLLSKDLSGTVDATAGGAVTLPDNSKITLNANSIVVRSNGQPYSGSVRVYATLIDPTAADIPQIVPGSLQATNANNQRSLLTSYGMMAVELESPAGEPLQIASGKKAKLTMKIPASLQSSSPQTLPLWYLNETDGLWREEGTATKNGNYYEGEVSHFSFWNCDVSNTSIYLEMTIHTIEGPLPGTLVKITRLNTNTSSYGWTDSLGYVAGFVPGGEPLKLEIMNNCNQAIYSQNIGPFSSSTNLGTIQVTLPTQNSVTITGTAVNCNNQPVTNGDAYIYWEGQLFVRPITNGNFSLVLTRCTNSSQTVEVVAIDNAANQQSTTFTGNATTGTVNTGQLVACGISSNSWINFTLDGNNFGVNTQNMDSVMAWVNTSGTITTYISGFNVTNQQVDISFTFNGAAVGTFPLETLGVNQYGQQTTTIVAPFNVNITTFGTQGQFIEGNMSGQFRDASNNLHTLSATFRVRRN